MPILTRITVIAFACLALVACGAGEGDPATLVPQAGSAIDAGATSSDESPRVDASVPDDGIPATWTPVPPAEAPTPFPTRVPDETYVVQPGDTLAEIALQFGVDLQRLISVNNIQNMDIIRVGEILVIPR